MLVKEVWGEEVMSGRVVKWATPDGEYRWVIPKDVQGGFFVYKAEWTSVICEDVPFAELVFGVESVMT